MKTKHEVETVVSNYASQIKTMLGDKLDAVILFGSYARGDYEDGSDVNVMVIVNIPQNQLAALRTQMRDIAFELEWENHLLLSIILESADVVCKYKGSLRLLQKCVGRGSAD